MSTKDEGDQSEEPLPGAFGFYSNKGWRRVSFALQAGAQTRDEKRLCYTASDGCRKSQKKAPSEASLFDTVSLEIFIEDDFTPSV